MENTLPEKIALRACPICSEKHVKNLHTQKFVLPEGHPLSNGYDVVSCSNCGFIYADVRVDQEAYNAFYAQFSKYGDSKTATGGGQSPSDSARLQETASIIASILPDKNARIVDIGCANGGLLKEIQSLGYRNLLGIDPAEVCVENTRKQQGIASRIGSLPNLPKQIGKFDLVILSHVLEHVQDLNQSITGIADLVRENGSVYIEVPDATRYAKQVTAPFQDFNTEHINHFSLNALRNLFAKVDFVARREARRTISINVDTTYPVIHMILQKDEPERYIRFDEDLNTQIIQYITRSKEILSGLNQRLQVILTNNPEVIVWGTGQLVMKLLADTCLGQAQIISFVDGNPINQGKNILGKPVLSPQELSSIAPYPIIITTLLHHRSIQEDIQRAGLLNPVYTLE